jgi:hypothetical protein
MADTGQTQQQEQKSRSARVAAVEESEAPFEGVLAAATALLELQAGSAAQPDADEVRALQRHSGNSAVMRLLAQRRSMPGKDHRHAPTSHEPVFDGVQRRQSPVAIQRSVTLDETVLVSYAQCSSFVNHRKLMLLGERSDFADDEASEPSELAAAITDSGGLAAYLGNAPDPSAEIDHLTAGLMQSWYAQFIEAFNACQSRKAATAAERVEAAEERLEELGETIDESVIPGLREQQRSAFRADESSELLAVADTLAVALDTALGCRGAIELVAGQRQALRTFANVALVSSGQAPLANNRAAGVLNALQRINRAYAGFQALRSSLAALEGSRTEAARGLGAVSAAASAYGAVGTLLGVSAGVSMYANFYLAPMVSAVTGAVSRMFDIVSRSQNRRRIEAGMFDIVAWNLEPGRRPVFEFMLAVMHAGGPSGVPTPVPPTVVSFFMSHQGLLEAGTGRGSDMPTTTSWLIFEELDQTRIARWVYRHRRSIWGMLYGDCDVPAGGS